MRDFSEDELFDFFRGNCSQNDINSLNIWLSADKNNKRKYRQAHRIYDLMLYSKMHEPESKIGTSFKKIFRYLSIAVCLVFIISASVFFTMEMVEKNIQSKRITMDVPSGQRVNVILEDGTRIALNSNAKLSYPAVFGKKSRTVFLSGEAMFDVKHDERRPFTVRTFASDVRVLGTKFNVKADEREDTFTTFLLEGSVKVINKANGSEYVILRPNEKVSIISGRFLNKTHYSHSDLSWTEGIIDITDITFVQLVHKLESAYGVKIIIETDRIPEMDNVSGEIRIADGIDHAIKVLQHISYFDYIKDRKTGNIYIR